MVSAFILIALLISILYSFVLLMLDETIIGLFFERKKEPEAMTKVSALNLGE
jgi:hypothetical protein